VKIRLLAFWSLKQAETVLAFACFSTRECKYANEPETVLKHFEKISFRFYISFADNFTNVIGASFAASKLPSRVFQAAGFISFLLCFVLLIFCLFPCGID